MIPRRAVVAGLAAAIMHSAVARAQARLAIAQSWDGTTTIPVAGTGFDRLTTALIHSKETTPTGMIQKSTEIVELAGDLKGFVLYHVTTVVNSSHGTLVNTGDQVFSGTIAGSAPAMIHDDQFRFDVNLATGNETGHVYLFDHIAGPKVKCALDVVGTGLNTEGNPTFTYKGQCTFLGANR
jgi:hypothetical protein